MTRAKIYTNSCWTTRSREWVKLLINSFGVELIPSVVSKFSGFHIKYCKVGEHGRRCRSGALRHFYFIDFPWSKCQSDLGGDGETIHGSNAACIEILLAEANRCVRCIRNQYLNRRWLFISKYLNRFVGFDVGEKFLINCQSASRADAWTHMTKVSVSMAFIHGTPKIPLTSMLIVMAAQAHGHEDRRFELWQLILINVWVMKT